MWSEASFDRDPPSVWSAEDFLPANQWDCWARFTRALNVGLRPFYAHAEHPIPMPVGEGLVVGVPLVGLYSAACRQVFNLVVEESTARRCESATCGRVFVHQVGGIEYRQHYRSTGLRFCSASCARNETQRQYRRRRKASIEKEKQP